eukprot:Blabericola_migrator_1__10356@NODE_582_length_7491_cov_233_955684_g431_i0_p1_GENE_NODE_582_length_7491_cov_233_955684_g431_i0NODE_582_length_7491_cov_233_955684_g431_i0_p1_ORF_typecomplete_len1234_score216_26DUF3712/PF12505_8/3_9e06DUF3712/PF12505_8/1_7e02DUF3712/PF12505_8/1_4e03DUF3712/PF12505_8/1_1e03_NODE_582_length_7491_cov_233_955684_g431_i025056206
MRRLQSHQDTSPASDVRSPVWVQRAIASPMSSPRRMSTEVPNFDPFAGLPKLTAAKTVGTEMCRTEVCSTHMAPSMMSEPRYYCTTSPSLNIVSPRQMVDPAAFASYDQPPRLFSPCNCVVRDSSSYYVLPDQHHTRSSQVLLDILQAGRDPSFCLPASNPPTENLVPPQSWRFIDVSKKLWSSLISRLHQSTPSPPSYLMRPPACGEPPEEKQLFKRRRRLDPDKPILESSKFWTVLVCILIFCLLVVLALIVLMVVIPHKIERELYYAKMYVDSVGITNVTSDGFNIVVDALLEKGDSHKAKIVTSDPGILIEYVKLEPDVLVHYARKAGVLKAADPEQEADHLNSDFGGGGRRLVIDLSPPELSASTPRIDELRTQCGDCWVDPAELKSNAVATIPIGYVDFEPILSGGRVSRTSLQGRLTLYDNDGFEAFCDDLVQHGSGAWVLSGVVNVIGGGINFRNIRFNRAMIMAGLPFPTTPATETSGGFEQQSRSPATPLVKTTGVWFNAVPDDEVSSSLSFRTQAEIVNESPMYIADLGDTLGFELWLEDHVVAKLQSVEMPMLIGQNTIVLAGHLLVDSPAFPTLLDKVTSGEDMPLEIKGDSQFQTDNPFKSVVNKIQMSTTFAGSAPGSLNHSSPILYKHVLEARLLVPGAPDTPAMDPDWVDLPKQAIRRLFETFHERRPERIQRRIARRARRRRLDFDTPHDTPYDTHPELVTNRALVRGDGRAMQFASDMVVGGIRMFGHLLDGFVANTQPPEVTAIGQSVPVARAVAKEETPTRTLNADQPELLDVVQGLVGLMLENNQDPSAAETRALPSARVGRLFNGIRQIFGPRPTSLPHTTPTVTNETALVPRLTLLDAPPGASIKFASSPSEMLEKVKPILMDSFLLRGTVLLGLWHPFSRISLNDMTMYGNVMFRSKDGKIGRVGSMAGRGGPPLLDLPHIIPANMTLATETFVWKRQRQLGIVHGKDDLMAADYQLTLSLDKNDPAVVEIIQSVVRDRQVQIQVSDFNYTATCLINGAAPIQLQKSNRVEYITINALSGLGSVRLSDFRFAPKDQLSLILVLEQKSVAPIVLDTGPLFLDWYFHDQMIGPAAINNLHFGPGTNLWEVRVGFYPLSSIMQHTAAFVQDIMSSSTLRFCVKSRRHNLSEAEQLKLATTPYPFNGLIQAFIEDTTEACMSVPNPLKEVNSGLSNLLPAVGQLIMNVLRDAALQSAAAAAAATEAPSHERR